MNLFLAFLAGAMTWSWLSRLLWHWILRSKGDISMESRTKFVERMAHDEFTALYSAMRQEATRRGI